MITISSNIVALVVTLLIPLAVALVTKSAASAAVKSISTMVLTAAVVLIRRSQVDGGASIISAQVAFDWTITTAIAIASYVGLWKPLANPNAKLAPTLGIG